MFSTLRQDLSFNRAQVLGLSFGFAFVVWSAVSVTTGERLGFSLAFGAVLVVLSVIDARRFVLPNPLTALVAGLGVAMTVRLTPDQWLHHLIGGVAGFLALVAIEKAFKALRGVDGLGRGDAKLAGAIGVWVTWLGLPSLFLYASFAGLIFGIAGVAFGRSARAPLPFGPFIAMGGWGVWLVGPLGIAGS